MLEAATILERLDAIMAELAALRSEIVAALPAPAVEGVRDSTVPDPAPEDWLEISTACERYNRPADSLRWLCRKQACGRKIGGRWQVSAQRIERYLNGGG